MTNAVMSSFRGEGVGDLSKGLRKRKNLSAKREIEGVRLERAEIRDEVRTYRAVDCLTRRKERRRRRGREKGSEFWDLIIR